uniref:Uncharacterized protein n=1 Tax=Geobacillus sp. (strain WCH70) TaxID=471223 RepID=C5DB14_GEOSW
MFRLPIEFVRTLEGKTCFVSRVKKDIELCKEFPLFTLHQIVYKILRKGERANYYTSRLAGEETFSNVRNAITAITGQTPNDSKVKEVYYQIRAHKNKSMDIREVHNGSQYLKQYQSYLKDELDWDDSMQTATWLLKKGQVSSLYKFSFQNIILIKPELLEYPNNANAKDFFFTWCEWISDHTKWNVYMVDKQGQVKKYHNGCFILINTAKTAVHSNRCFFIKNLM